MTKVCLISVTPDAEKTIGYIARVSNPNNQDNPKVAGLLKYCIKHGHWSVFEQASMTLEIHTTRAIAAQVLRHRSFTFQEFSQRYADSSLLGDSIPLPQLRRQDDKNKLPIALTTSLPFSSFLSFCAFLSSSSCFISSSSFFCCSKARLSKYIVTFSCLSLVLLVLLDRSII